MIKDLQNFIFPFAIKQCVNQDFTFLKGHEINGLKSH